jgi:nicotinamidase-related amidase
VPNAFGDTNLFTELQRLGITDVVLMGQYLEQCVQTTALDAAFKGFRLHTSPEVLQSAAGRPNFLGWEAIPTAQVVADHRGLLPLLESARAFRFTT